MAVSVAIDADDDIYVAGHTSGDLDGETLSGIIDIFLSKFSSDGDKQFTHLLGVSGSLSYSSSVATHSTGNVYITGYTSGNFDGNTKTGSTDIFSRRHPDFFLLASCPVEARDGNADSVKSEPNNIRQSVGTCLPTGI